MARPDDDRLWALAPCGRRTVRGGHRAAGHRVDPALVMSLAGRVPYTDELDGPGAPTLRDRVVRTGG